jgi:excisionase family DNA binding protein
MTIGTWLSPAEAAAYLRLSVKALHHAVARREVRAHRLGRRLRFRIADLDAALRPPEDEGAGRRA